MNKLLLAVVLLAPSFSFAAKQAKPNLTKATARADIRKALGSGMMGNGWNLSLGATKRNMLSFYANQRPARNWRGGLGPVLIPASGKISLRTGKIMFNRVE